MAATPIRPLPSYLTKRYKAWYRTDYEDNRSWFQHLAEMGQRPRAMVISCCDSRVHVTSIFGAESGEFFIHRNIANLIPPFNPSGDHHGTSAAIEFAVTALQVAHIIVLGHSGCGGIQNGYHVCNQTDGHPLKDTSFIYKWLQILKPACDRLPESGHDNEKIAMLEKQSVITSLENLIGFPFVADAVASGSLSLHGLWHDIGNGTLMGYNAETDRFEAF
ncbi:MAG: carbonic anhydrase [Candidatus Puniceispirillales bacterium]